MKHKNTLFYRQQAANLLVKKNNHHEDMITENVNDMAEGAVDNILFHHYVKSNPREGVMVRAAQVTLASYEQVVDAVEDFKKDKEAKELFVPISFGRHVVHAYVKKTDNNKFEFEYSDPYGSKSPYGNPPEELVEQLESKFGKGNIIFKPNPMVQQRTSNSCFAINYQNMVDKYEGRTPSIKPVINGMEDPLIKVVRLKMKQDLAWLYNQYNEVWEKVQRHAEEQHPEMFQAREAMRGEAHQGEAHGDSSFRANRFNRYYDAEEQGHMPLNNTEVNKAMELLEEIDFSKAPSQNKTSSVTADVEFPPDLKTKLQSDGYSIRPLYDPKNLFIIGYTVNIPGDLSSEKLHNISNNIEKELPESIRNRVICSMKEPNDAEETLSNSSSMRMS